MEAPKIRQIHPMFVHFPMALFPVAFGAFSLFMATGVREFESGSFVCALFGLLAAPLTTASGFLDWWTHYKAYMTSVFRIKIVGSFLVMILAASAVLLRAFHPDLAVLPLGGLGWIYFGLLAACTATSVVVGYYGGKLVFH
ncbi:MAG: hypothetical protein AUK27_10805 [Deltaproteobacteria bacterium CG2_30_66_27]|nr:MAG: hypothetical protein AUK27_10805 [Deltaproteobacteria bacterium CG2_30_66_27]PJB31327.1 MAG: hypothetical protein CO109_10555 [Deltaproteobacteria bacterium CG_4_9_14_3_um_filter_65_9]